MNSQRGPDQNGMRVPRTFFPIILVLVIASGSFYAGRVFAPTSPTVPRTGTGGPVGPCTWFVSMDGTTPVAEAMVGGLSVNPGDNVVGTAGQDPAAFIVGIETAGQAICLSGQVFSVQSPLSFNVNNMMLKGSGWATIIRASASFTRVPTYGAISGIVENLQQSNVGVQNITIADLQIDGNKGARSFLADDEGIRFDGAINSMNRNIKIDNVYVHDVYGSCIALRYTDVYVITRSLVEKCSIAGQGGIYHGIYTIRSSNGAVTDDTARSMLDGSGFKVGVGNFNEELSNDNSLLNAKDGFEYSGAGGSDIVRDVTATSDIAANNTLNGWDLNVAGGDNRLAFSSITAVFNTINGFITNFINNMTLTGCTIMNNSFGGGGWQGIRVLSTTHMIITGCRVGDSQSVKTQTYGLLVGSSSNITATGNDFSGNLGSAYRDNGGNQNSTIVLRSNAGMNPFGRIGFRVGTSIVPWGTASTALPSTTYTIGGADCFITASGGAGLSITITSSDGQTVASGLATLTAQWLVIGYKVNFGAFSGGPTINVFFN